MHVFISWSGDASREVATALRRALRQLLQAVDPWMSAEDIQRGSRWLAETSLALDRAEVGVVCVTPGNLESAWLLFEAGALGKSIDSSRVIPFLHGVSIPDLPTPLGQFQATTTSREGTYELLATLNEALGSDGRSEAELSEGFELWWPCIENWLGNVPSSAVEEDTRKSDRQVLEDILGHVTHLRFRTDGGHGMAVTKGWSRASVYDRASWPAPDAPPDKVEAFFRGLIDEARTQALKSYSLYQSQRGPSHVQEETARRSRETAAAAGFGEEFDLWLARRRQV